MSFATKPLSVKVSDDTDARVDDVLQEEVFYTPREVNTPNFRTTPQQISPDSPHNTSQGALNVTHVYIDAFSVLKLDFSYINIILLVMCIHHYMSPVIFTHRLHFPAHLLLFCLYRK